MKRTQYYNFCITKWPSRIKINVQSISKRHPFFKSYLKRIYSGDWWELRKMVVDASCNVTWVSYNVTSGQPKPTGTLVGGFTPLFMSKLTIYGINVVGHYNPFNHKAWGQFHGPLIRYVKLQVAHAPGMPEKIFPHRRFQSKPLVSDPGMHHGTCVTHVP